VGGARPPPFTTFTITSKVAVYAPAEWADTLTLFHLYQYMYSVVYALAERADTLPLFLLYPYIYSVVHARITMYFELVREDTCIFESICVLKTAYILVHARK
jgi:hypothetical protein